jgi:peptide/nickel transport system substrate-binding protein
MYRLSALLLWFALLGSACAPVSSSTSSADLSSPATPQRVLVIANRFEPFTLSSKQLLSGGESRYLINNLFNAGLGLEDESGVVGPELAESLPQLETDTWRVFSDGRMDTIYRLKPNLVWQDGTALSAEDFVFAWGVFASPVLGVANSPPINVMEEVTAPDDRTVAIRWRRPYPDAGALDITFPPLPRHALASAFENMRQTGDSQSFTGLPFWTHEFVGLGPYRVTRWEPGAWIEAEAFENFVLGRPKIDRVQVRIILDENLAATNLLSGDVHVGTDSSLQWAHAVILKQGWEHSKAGTVIVAPQLLEATYFQFRPDYQAQPGLLDVRVRKALAYALNKQDLIDGLFDGQWQSADTILNPAVLYFAEVDRAIIKYPYDLKRSADLMQEAGFIRGQDGTWTHPTQGRMAFEHKVNDGAQNVSEGSIISRGWRTSGFDVSEAVLPRALIQDGEARATYSGAFTYAGGGMEASLATVAAPALASASNRWTGNRNGWTHQQYDRIGTELTGTLDQSRRVSLIAQLLRIISEDVPNVTLYYRPFVVAHTSALQGPQRVSPKGGAAANIHNWIWLR